MLAVYLSRIAGGVLLMFFGGWSVIIAQKDSYKKPRILRKRLSKKEKIMKFHFAVFGVAGAFGWIVAESHRFFDHAGLIGFLTVLALVVINTVWFVLRLKNSGIRD
ncbi:hypothetical protein JXA84_06625 [candidate division WOR-3 bacterium]|nr:hypothetical protein [candidate division WOR-3 bacterium]